MGGDPLKQVSAQQAPGLLRLQVPPSGVHIGAGGGVVVVASVTVVVVVCNCTKISFNRKDKSLHCQRDHTEGEAVTVTLETFGVMLRHEQAEDMAALT